MTDPHDRLLQALSDADTAAKAGQSGVIYNEHPVTITVGGGQVKISVNTTGNTLDLFAQLSLTATNDHAKDRQGTPSHTATTADFTYIPR